MYLLGFLKTYNLCIAGSEVMSIKTPKRKRFCVKRKTLSPKCQRIYEEYKQAKKKLNFAERAKRAVKFSKKGFFEKMSKNLNPISKKLIWMQLKQCTKKTKGRRFTEEEKIIALSIMKQSPKSYRFLRRIFILPSIRTLNKLTSTLAIDSGINPHIFNSIKSEVSTLFL